MSKISLKPNASGTATFEIEAPATNTNRTLVLPDEAGTVLSNVSDIETQVKTATNASGDAPIYACRAWVNFDGTTTTPTIRGSGNVSSVTKNSTGDYTVNFTTAMPDANYAAAGVAGGFDLQSAYGRVISVTTSSIRVDVRNIGTGANLNRPQCHLAIFR